MFSTNYSNRLGFILLDGGRLCLWLLLSKHMPVTECVGSCQFCCSLNDIDRIRIGKIHSGCFLQTGGGEVCSIASFFVLLSHCSQFEVNLKPVHADFILSISFFCQEKSLFFTRILWLNKWSTLLIEWRKRLFLST